jgi:hypothetical protein
MKRRPGPAGLARGLWIAAALSATLVTGRALADLEVRAAKFTWDKTNVLRGTFAFRDAVDDKVIAKKLTNGLKVTLAWRGYVFPNGGGDSVALVAHTCSVAYDLWNEVYNVRVDEGKTQISPNMNGVYRRCTDMSELIIVDRTVLKGKPESYFLAVKVEVNPVSEDTLKKIQQWVTRPTGASGGISPGDALFASFVGVFMKKVATADKVVEFRTAAFPN